MSPRSSRHRLEHRGAFGESTEEGSGTGISELRREVVVEESSSDGSATDGVGSDGASCRGTSLPSEKSSSAGSIATGSWRRNSKSTISFGDASRSEVSGTGEGFSGFLESSGRSRLKDIRGLSHPYAGGQSRKFSGETPALLTRAAEAISDH